MTAGCEIAGALLILPPRTAIFGAALLTCVMVGAPFCHLVVIGGNKLPAVILLLLNLVVLWLHRRGPPACHRRNGVAQRLTMDDLNL